MSAWLDRLRGSGNSSISLVTAFLGARHFPGKFHLLSALLAGDLRQRRLSLRKLLLRGRWQQTFPDGLLPSELAGPANGLGPLAGLPLRRLLVGTPLFHFPEDALTLHLLLQNTKRLIDIVVANKYLQLKSSLGCERGKTCMQPMAQEFDCGDEKVKPDSLPASNKLLDRSWQPS